MNARSGDYDGIYLHEYKDVHLTDCILVVGFPSVGLISSIAANYIVRTMKLDRIAAIVSPDFPPYTIVQDGLPSHPVRIFAGKRACEGGPGESCQQIVVILAEFMPRPELLMPMADLMLDWAKHKGVHSIITLEGMNVGEEENSSTLSVGTTDKAREIIMKYKIGMMADGMVSGMSAILLSEGERMGLDVVCLLGPAKADIPDARGAANLLEIIGRMLPELKLDPEPLLKEAEQIEQGMKAAMQTMKQPKKQPADQSFLYG
ncbi:MAG: PAC2 family protein [Methanomassiliicoccales archaeon PtaU1.Bin124]|nr:MAG: PAC2 family protein [Methanomassiliicoccales archaeon PtaU1.Bin124]